MRIFTCFLIPVQIEHIEGSGSRGGIQKKFWIIPIRSLEKQSRGSKILTQTISYLILLESNLSKIRGYLQIHRFEDSSLCPVQALEDYLNKVM